MKTLSKLAMAATAAVAALGAAAPASAQVEPYISQAALFATNWCPKGWAQANGQLLSITQNQALFSLYGTYYGGDGRNTFALPNLQNRAPISWSNTNPIGSSIGTSVVTLTVQQLPMHTHFLLASSTNGTTSNPSGATLSTFPTGQTVYAANTSTPDVVMNAASVQTAGGGQPISIQSPVLAMTWCVATSGVFPSRN